MNSTLTSLKHSFRLLGPGGTIALLLEKRRKRKHHLKMMQEVRAKESVACFRGTKTSLAFAFSDFDTIQILERADAMLLGENHFFTFEYSLRLPQPWNFDPIENKYWPKRYYSETILHADDTPKDVKIVWEINRFKDLPTLAQAALLSGETKYRDEIEHRILSWIEDNPPAGTINWASALEIAIRLVSWTTSLALLKHAGLEIPAISAIGKSIWQQATYLAQDLSVDKVVRSNHLIGEVAGLFVVSQFWTYPEASAYEADSRRILEKEIFDQTYPDGSTKESSTWYHQFVTNFFQIVERVSIASGRPMSKMYLDRLGKMESFLDAMRPQIANADASTLVRIGDGDDGWAIFFEGRQLEWFDAAFGPSNRSHPYSEIFPIGGYAAMRRGENYAAMRAGPFGMGGDGFSSHAHDDCLSPIVYLDGNEILVDPGTYVYNGAPEKRKEYREVSAHNGVEIKGLDMAEQKFNFGWKRVRPDAGILEAGSDEEASWCSALYGESRKAHTREIRLEPKRFIVSDTFSLRAKENVTLRYHLAPGWNVLAMNGNTATLAMGDRRILFEQGGANCSLSSTEYHYSPSYLREESAVCLVLTAELSAGLLTSTFTLT